MVLVLAAAAAACSTSTEPGTGGVALVVGAYCGSSVHSTASLEAGTWTVVVFYNHTTTRPVTGSDGIVRTQTVRSCEQSVVVFQNATFGSPAEAIAAAGGELGVTPVL